MSLPALSVARRRQGTRTSSRRAANAYASFKAEAYARTGALLFVKSSSRLAVEVGRLSGKSVFCLETRTMIEPEFLSRARRPGQELPSHLLRWIREAVQAVRRFGANHHLR